MNARAFCIMSGGADSTLAALEVRKEYNDIEAIFFDWGQRALNEEKAAVESICKAIDIKRPAVIRVPIDQWDRSDLTRGNKKRIMNPKNIIVPERNLIFIALAASYARTKGGGYLIVGFNKDDAGYDTSEEFVEMLNKIFQICDAGLVGAADRRLKSSYIRLVAPLIKKDKKYIIAKLKKHCLLAKTYSCYVANGPCGECLACKKRQLGGNA